MQMGLCARPIPRSTTKEACADVCQAYRCVFFTVVSQGTAEAQMQKRLRNTAGQKGDAWKKQLATVTGVKYKPEPQQEDSWEDSTGVYDTDGNQLSLEGISEDDNDDDVWVDDFEDDTGVTEDKEIFNMDTGWSIQDFQGVVQQPPERQVQHSSRSPLVYYAVLCTSISYVYYWELASFVLYQSSAVLHHCVVHVLETLLDTCPVFPLSQSCIL